MKDDNISQLGDYDVPFCEQQFTHGSCYMSLFKFNSFDQFITPQTASNLRHLLSCGTIVLRVIRPQVCLKKVSENARDEDARGPSRNRNLQEEVQSEQKLTI